MKGVDDALNTAQGEAENMVRKKIKILFNGGQVFRNFLDDGGGKGVIDALPDDADGAGNDLVRVQFSAGYVLDNGGKNIFLGPDIGFHNVVKGRGGI